MIFFWKTKFGHESIALDMKICYNQTIWEGREPDQSTSNRNGGNTLNSGLWTPGLLHGLVIVNI
ncbi:unnamed protein product [Acanthoscelides obtectus]|uniref:Uncharacterized protein n=1 Tax=Acanthoscelides obtectus TaxID=200917 RepID=A0A9P0L2X1_ACAOB|nr:unnamed protein product [Acanthoscelides obtectus]CAK1648277.1 hypothetical protein AOBTE_LOCUS15638 [Acanthoscelides obtectus]